MSNCKVCKAWQKSGRNQAKGRAARILRSCQQSPPIIIVGAYIIIAGLVGGYVIGLVVENRREEGKDTYVYDERAW